MATADGLLLVTPEYDSSASAVSHAVASSSLQDQDGAIRLAAAGATLAYKEWWNGRIEGIRSRGLEPQAYARARS